MPFLLGTFSLLQTIVYLLIVLGIMVLVHEFGHFAMAKLCGVRVETFSIGFGKRIFGVKRGETDYRISLLPLGGYVKMAGDSPGEAPSGDGGEFNAHPRWQRVLIALAGPFANFVLASVLMTGVYMLHHDVQQYLSNPAISDYVQQNSAAARIGMRSGDTIVHFDTIENPTWEQVHIRSMLNLNQSVPVSFLHNGQRVNTTLTIVAKGNPEDFGVDDLGLIPQVQSTPIEILKPRPGMPAERAGLQAGDKILSVDGLVFHGVPALLAYMQDQGGKPMSVTILRNGSAETKVIRPVLSDSVLGGKTYQLGFPFVQPPVKVEQMPFGRAVAASL